MTAFNETDKRVVLLHILLYNRAGRMIISHQHKFIFSKPRKVAGSSVEVALAKHCGPEDIITPLLLDEKTDADQVNNYARNDVGYFNHIRPFRIRQEIGRSIWDEYFKFTIVRNPWDMLVSRYFWNKQGLQRTTTEILQHLQKKPFSIDRWGKLAVALDRQLRNKVVLPTDDFRAFIQKLHGNVANTKYYFDWKGTPWNDAVIRYEHLDADYKQICERIGIPYEPLPQLKTKVRKKQHYTEFYDDETREIVAKRFKKEIDYFQYTFGD